MSFYSDMADTAKELIAEFGQPLTLMRETGGGFDNITGTPIPGTVEELPCQGVWLEISEQINTALGGTVQAGDRVVMLDASQEPLQADLLLVDQSPWSIVKIQPIAPGGVALAYYVQVRA